MPDPRFPDPLPALKQRVADEILVLLAGWTQEMGANRMLKSHQSRLSELRRGKLDRFSLDRLVRFLSLLGREVAIVTRERPRCGRSSLDHAGADELSALRALPPLPVRVRGDRPDQWAKRPLLNSIASDNARFGQRPASPDAL